MITVSLCMIVKNEEAVIGRCLEAIHQAVDEIIIVDTGSSDKTKEIVAQYTNKIYDFQWVQDFSKVRNYSFQKAIKDYILWLDADDVFTKENVEKLIQLKSSLIPSVDAVSMLYGLSFDEHENVNSSLRRYRLVKKEKNFQWIGAVHEYLDVSGNLYDTDIIIHHLPLARDTNRNIEIYERMLEENTIFTPRDMYYYANELADHHRMEEAIKMYKKFLNSNLGWVEDNIQACLKLADCYQQLGQDINSMTALLKTFTYDLPRPEACCKIGAYFMDKNEVQQAIYWYEQAVTNKERESTFFQTSAYSTWLPHLQLAVLYDRLQQFKKASEHNKQALYFKKEDPIILQNEQYFNRILSKNGD